MTEHRRAQDARTQVSPDAVSPWKANEMPWKPGSTERQAACHPQDLTVPQEVIGDALKEATRPATIWVIDAHPAVRMLRRGALEHAGSRVWEVATGREGLELFRAHPVDLIITDLAMPEMNGLELTVE